MPTHTTFPIIQDNRDVINRLLADNILSLSSNNHLIVHPDAFLSPVERDIKALQKIKYGLTKYLEEIQYSNIKEDSVAATIVRTFAYNYENLDKNKHTVITNDGNLLDFSAKVKAVVNEILG